MSLKAVIGLLRSQEHIQGGFHQNTLFFYGAGLSSLLPLAVSLRAEKYWYLYADLFI
ncbi:hypothetical protein [Pseudoalteromonas denitrificans]|jgi:hypothetical protein|uniref:Uncharacterized protein n=1 Tax=Pseudoalteromonas denitrificans DSM 6059 TaxID=1123010 RepID=A0A1I1H0J4_9GAMM|nr:hypothetical protein [Pseudoalteromonas denitrificans]SFC17301.1 hypothetical protein SAMN02745724_01094 [Pseudoalteromonas denitrificans DSM 6059]